jgi:hypothetical protein
MVSSPTLVTVTEVTVAATSDVVGVSEVVGTDELAVSQPTRPKRLEVELSVFSCYPPLVLNNIEWGFTNEEPLIISGH